MIQKRIRILCLDDDRNDALLIREKFLREGLDIRFDYVSTKKEYINKLDTEKYDIILSDYNMPGFNGIAALLYLNENCPGVPFICVSGTIGEDLAVELIHLGASDYILKNKLQKLPVAVQRVLREVESQQARINALNELKENKEKYQNLVENINDVIYEIDSKGVMTYMSPIINTITGFPDTFYIGNSFLNFVYEKDLPETLERFKNIISKGPTGPFEFRISNEQGELIWLRTSSKPVIKDGISTGLRGTAINITEQKSADEKIRKLSGAIEQSPVSVIITDLEGKIEYVNEAVIKLTGYSPEELIGKNPRIFSSGEKPEEVYKSLWETISSGNEWNGEFHNKKKTGELYWESASISPILDEKEEMTHYLAVKEDITEKKKIIDELIIAKDKAEESSRLKSAFLTNISHEIRTPLNGIMGFADLLQNPELTPEEEKMYFGILKESGERMLNTINDIIEMSKIEAGHTTLNITIVDINEIIIYFYNLFKPETEEKGLSFILSNSLKGKAINIQTDKNKLVSILGNLLKNAIKFTSDGFVEFGSKTENDMLVFYVKDTGLGIPANRMTAIFHRFVQAELAITRPYEGAGLGLSIATSYANLIGGRINVESEEGVGSTFSFLMPFIQSEPETKTFFNSFTEVPFNG